MKYILSNIESTEIIANQIQIDAFTGRVFGGNPAAVCPLKGWSKDNLLQY